MVCSCHFISGRELEDIKKNDLYSVSFATVEINETSHSVSSSIYGIAKTTAVFRDGFGCTLLNEVSEDSLKNQTFPYSRNPSQHIFPVVAISSVFDSVKLDAVMQPVFNDDSARTVQTRAVIILKDGMLLYENYGTGYNKNSRLIGWSMTKSVTNV